MIAELAESRISANVPRPFPRMRSGGWERDYSCVCSFICGFLLNLYPLTHTPPGTSDEHLTVVKSLMNARPEGAIIVTTPQEMALSTIRKEINFCRKMKVKILGIVENMSGFVCPCCQVGACMHMPIQTDGVLGRSPG